MVWVTCSAGKSTILPARKLAWASAASSGSTPITLHGGLAQFDGGGDAADHSATTDRNQYGFDVGQVFENFQSDGALSGDDLFVVVGRDDGVSVLGGQLLGFEFALRLPGPTMTISCAHCGGRFKLDGWGVSRHDDDGFRPQRPCGVGHSLRVVATRIGDYAATSLLL